MELTVMNQKFPQLFLPMLSSVFLLLIMPCQAAENGGNEDPFFQELPIVLTASRLSQPQSESPSEITVIDREMIKASGFRTVPDLMRLVPGMYVGYADANRALVSLHNSTDEFAHRMQIMIDGRSIYLPPFGGVNWADLPLLIDDIERIEVVRGPSTASHGTNAFYGVINIISREASGQKGGSVSITGGFATDASARVSQSSELFDYRFSTGYRSDAGLDNGKLNDHNSTRVFNWRSNYHPNSKDSFDLQLGASNGVYGLGIVDKNGITRKDNLFRETTTKNEFQQLTWLHQWSTQDESKLTYSHTARNALDPLLCINTDTCDGNKEPATPREMGFVQLAVYSQRDVLELQNTNQLGDSNRLVWGANSNRDFASYPLFLGPGHTVNSWQVFAHDEWRITQAAILNIGSMFEENGMGSENNSPRASLNYHF
jgi:iron complex outermembrane receptor protein